MDQLTVFQTLAKSLGSKFGEESEVELQAKKRAETLELMGRVAQRLELPPGTAPTANQWRSVWREVAPEWSATRVHELWGRYEFAKRAFRGEPVPEGSAQRAARRDARARGQAHEDPIEGLQMWLADDPDSLTQADYEEFVGAYNREVKTGKRTGLPLVGVQAIRSALRIPWLEVLAAARGELDARDAGDEHDRELLASANQGLGLVGLQEVELLLDETRDRTKELTNETGFPQPVALLGGNRAWLASDVVAFRDELPFPPRKPGEMQRLIMTSEDVARAFGLKSTNGLPRKLALLRKQGRGREPDGSIGNTHYWERETTEPWIQATRDVRRRSSR